jgi:hypothetical protein
MTSTTVVSGCFTDTGDETIHDTCTGLQWEKKDGTVLGTANAADLHDVNNAYSWSGCCGGDCSTPTNYCQPNVAAATTCAAQSSGGTEGCIACVSGTCDVDPLHEGALTTVWDWINQVNAAHFAGHGDWRLPSESACNSCYDNTALTCASCSSHELETILLAPSPCGPSPCIAPIFGPTESGHCWSATLAPGPKYAWVVAFGTLGDVIPIDCGTKGAARAVRSSP